MNRKRFSVPVTMLVLLLATASGVTAQDWGPARQDVSAQAVVGTAFTYQGQLRSNGSLVTGTCDLEFLLFNAASGGAQIGATQTAGGLSIVNGLFSVALDFSVGAFEGSARWLEIRLRCPAGSGSYTTLAPRQALTPAPYALALPGLYTLQNDVSPNVIAGYSGNVISATVVGGAVGGGGNSSSPNRVWSNYATVAGGYNNTAGGLAGAGSFVGGGYNNSASGSVASIAGGLDNRAGSFAAVAGGERNQATGLYAAVGGGFENIASNGSATVGGGINNIASGQYSTIGGGTYNAAGGIAAAVVGGGDNTASGLAATVAGGSDNAANGRNAIVAGGEGNMASGSHSFAAGRGAQSLHDGAFVWADASGLSGFSIPPITSTVANQFLVRASGGITLYTDADATVGAALAPGSGSWSSVSDRTLKANLAPVDTLEILERLNHLPIHSWNYTTQDPAIRHIGPSAQDFHAAFAVGESDTAISAVDAQGVALAALQGLYQVVRSQDVEIAEQRRQIADLEARLAVLEQVVSRGQPEPAAPATALLMWVILGTVLGAGSGCLCWWVMSSRGRPKTEKGLRP